MREAVISFQITLHTLDCICKAKSDRFNKCHRGLSHAEVYRSSDRANVEAGFDLKNVLVLLNYLVLESIRFSQA